MAEAGPHHRRGHRPAPRAGRRARAAPAAAALPAARRIDTFRNVAVAYGDDNPLWCDPDYGVKTRWEGAIAPPPLVGGDTLVGEDEVTAVAPEQRELMKGDPLRGVHAFYAASAREWWAPLYPQRRVFRRNALGGRARQDRASSRAARCTSGRRRCSATRRARSSSGQYRLMVRTEREKAREKKKYDAVELAAYTDEQIDEIEAQYDARARARRRAALVGRRARGRRGRADGEGPAHRHRHDLLARGHGHGPLRRAAAAPRLPEPQAHPAVLPPRSAERPRRDAARALGSRSSRAGPATRPPTTTAACARRGSSTSAPTGWVTMRGSGSSTASSARFNYVGDTQWLRGRVVRKLLADGDRPAVELELEAVNQRGEATTPGPRDDPAAEPRARRGAASRSARRRDAICRARSSAISAEFSRR